MSPHPPEHGSPEHSGPAQSSPELTQPAPAQPAPVKLVLVRPVLVKVWAAIVVAVVGVGLVVQLWLLLTGGADVNSGETGESAPLGVRFVRLISFFTVDANVLVLVVAIAELAGRTNDGMLWRALRLCALLSIAVTGAVFSIVLDPSIQLRGEAVIVNTLFHNVAPVVYVVGWLVLGRRRDWDVRSVLLAFVPPVVWLVLTFIRGAVTGWYPYPFLDVNVHGLGLPLGGAAAVLLLAAVFAGIMLAVDRWLPSLAWASKPVRSR